MVAVERQTVLALGSQYQAEKMADAVPSLGAKAALVILFMLTATASAFCERLAGLHCTAIGEKAR